MTRKEREKLLAALSERFERNFHRHERVAWPDVVARLEGNPDALASIWEMESTGGEPDVIVVEPESGRYGFCDCSAESPAGRRSLCFDGEALDARRAHKPDGSAMEMAVAMGVELLTEAQYRELQRFGEFDTKTSSWVRTPEEIRAQGGALFCDRRYGRVFTYHNGAQSYYAARGFRAIVHV